MSLQIIDQNGVEILLVDFSQSHCRKEMLSKLSALACLVREQPRKYRALVDFTGQLASIKFVKEAIRLNEELFDQHTMKAAIIGISELQKVLLKAYNAVSINKMLFFKNKEEAFSYLVK